MKLRKYKDHYFNFFNASYKIYFLISHIKLYKYINLYIILKDYLQMQSRTYLIALYLSPIFCNYRTFIITIEKLKTSA